MAVDDFAPRGSSAQQQQLHGKADRLLRAQGNRSGRGRMRPDGSLQLTKPPRGLILSTGRIFRAVRACALGCALRRSRPATSTCLD